ncbi:MAG: DUF1015 domain-containing protein [Nocardiopsaceae bacterium]|nr:DUF1015 domain-containing protein [Nocardiopsaceae bacterium]
MEREAGRDALELAPFRGLRYAASDARPLIDSFNLALALVPPYDVLDAASVFDLMRAEPHNAARLTAPPAAARDTAKDTEPPGFGQDRYAAAAGTLRRWINDGILVRDPVPVLYVYEQTSPGGLRQRGLIGALRLPAHGNPAVRPHEDVAPDLVADRAELMAAARANLEPIFLLYRGGTGAGRGAAAQATDAAAEAGTPPLVDTVTDDGMAHRLWAIDEPDIHSEIAADLATRTALIADGHHRYAAYQRLRDRQDSPGPWDHGLALLVDSDSSPPRVGAIHRVLRDLDVHAAARAASSVADVERLPSPAYLPHGLRAADRRLRRAAADGPALLLAGTAGPGTDPGATYLLRGLTAVAAPGRSPVWRALPTAALEELLSVWGVGDDRVHLVHDDPAEALAALRPGRDCAVVLPPLKVEDVYAVAEQGELTPRKSTSFGPKPRTGLVLRVFDS